MDDEKILNASALSYLDQLDSSRYPRTKSEADKMSEVLQQAYDAADNTKDEVFAERYQTLRGIADWSLKRHKSWQWTLVVAALVGAAVLYFFHCTFSNTVSSPTFFRHVLTVSRLPNGRPSKSTILTLMCVLLSSRLMSIPCVSPPQSVTKSISLLT